MFCRVKLAFIFSIIFFTTAISQENARRDSFLTALKSVQNDTAKVKLLYGLSNAVNENDEIFKYAEQALTLAEKLCASENTAEAKVGLKARASALHNMGFVYVDKGEIEKGLDYMEKALIDWRRTGDRWGIAMTLGNIGYIYQNQGALERSLDYYFESMKLREEIRDDEGLAYNLNNIGFIYWTLKQPDKTIEYYRRALAIREKSGNKVPLAQSLHNIAFIYEQQSYKCRDADSARRYLLTAMKYYQRGLRLREMAGDKSGIAGSLNNLGYILLTESRAGNSDSSAALKARALAYFQRALKLREEIQDKKGISNSLLSVANALKDQKKYAEAEMKAAEALKLAKELGFPKYVKDAAGSLSDIYKNENKFNLAYEMHVLYMHMSDSLNSLESQRALTKKQAQYEFEKKMEAARSAQEKKDVLAEAERKEQERIRNIFIAGFGLVFVLLLLILRGYIGKRKANKLILKQKAEVESAKEIIETQNHLLQEKQKEIVDSINYAGRIQKALMATDRYIQRHLRKLGE
jgi:tetratricopeptide (TPR) repeat protein